MKTLLKVILPVTVLAVAGLATVVMVRSRDPVQPRVEVKPLPLVEVMPLVRQDYRFQVRAQGTVTAPTEINLVTEVSGQVVAVAAAFTEGGFFETGDRLVRVDPRDYSLAVTQAQARLAEAQVQLQREQAEANVAKSEWVRLGEGEAGPLLLREPQLAQAQAMIDSAQANLDKARLDLGRCEIRAPFSGRIRSKRADVGQFLNRGETVARVYAVDYAEVPLPLPLDDVVFVDLPVGYRGEAVEARGPRVLLRAQFGTREARWEGRVVRTVGEIDPRTRMLTAVARVEDPYGRGNSWDDPPLAVGLFVEAEIEGVEAKGVYLAPREAFRSDRDLMVVDSSERLFFRKVERLRIDGDQVVFRGELAPGDRACLTLLAVATDGMAVRVIGEVDPEMLPSTEEPQR